MRESTGFDLIHLKANCQMHALPWAVKIQLLLDLWKLIYLHIPDWTIFDVLLEIMLPYR